jgi:signal transduction histidine kinase
MGRLTSGIAHHLNIILTIILGNTELLSRALAAEPIDVGALLARMHAMLVRTLGRRITIELVRNGETWPALANPPQIESAVLDRRVNARDAMQEGGPQVAPFAVRPSMIAVVGLASRPAWSHTARWSAWWRRAIVPSRAQRETSSHTVPGGGSCASTAHPASVSSPTHNFAATG